MIRLLFLSKLHTKIFASPSKQSHKTQESIDIFSIGNCVPYELRIYREQRACLQIFSLFYFLCFQLTVLQLFVSVQYMS
jgi:hypothetical protein